MRNVFVENHIKNVVEKLSLDPFLKTEIEHNPGSVVFKVLWNLLLLYADSRAIKIYWKQAADHLFLSYIELF